VQTKGHPIAWGKSKRVGETKMKGVSKVCERRRLLILKSRKKKLGGHRSVLSAALMPRGAHTQIHT
jgi:hypothetical protein